MTTAISIRFQGGDSENFMLVSNWQIAEEWAPRFGEQNNFIPERRHQMNMPDKRTIVCYIGLFTDTGHSGIMELIEKDIHDTPEIDPRPYIIAEENCTEEVWE